MPVPSPTEQLQEVGTTIVSFTFSCFVIYMYITSLSTHNLSCLHFSKNCAVCSFWDSQCSQFQWLSLLYDYFFNLKPPQKVYSNKKLCYFIYRLVNCMVVMAKKLISDATFNIAQFLIFQSRNIQTLKGWYVSLSELVQENCLSGDWLKVSKT